jgi:hypothetical protein
LGRLKEERASLETANKIILADKAVLVKELNSIREKCQGLEKDVKIWKEKFEEVSKKLDKLEGVGLHAYSLEELEEIYKKSDLCTKTIHETLIKRRNKEEDNLCSVCMTDKVLKIQKYSNWESLGFNGL